LLLLFAGLFVEDEEDDDDEEDTKVIEKGAVALPVARSRSSRRRIAESEAAAADKWA
jgi:hypothetical protein